RKMTQNGILGLIFAHLFSLQLMREIFAEQVRLGKVPQVVELPTR
ncbi:multidrug transporter, partial [Escherichia coli]